MIRLSRGGCRSPSILVRILFPVVISLRGTELAREQARQAMEHFRRYAHAQGLDAYAIAELHNSIDGREEEAAITIRTVYNSGLVGTARPT